MDPIDIETLAPADLARIAAGFEAAAVLADDAARDGLTAAADPTEAPAARALARRCAAIARRHAADYRAEAAVLRTGHVPDSWT
ncbi:hypothetical protein [Streptomyces chryseus]|uniref:Uncharacterized protein n=1 Tax=Streptomyces chryseus TaxID=68186 RepID=A0ABQ3EE28_9ACTN|nr:hypothetical protein [Streptomyces chryseus]GHB31142.1 hypothetical protein GCM10010346_63160 [Streptomyces chryseus]